MKIAIATSENTTKALIDTHFGRCEWFCVFDTETKNVEFIGNSAKNQAENAGSEAIVLLLGKGVNVAVAGRFGSKVVEICREMNMQMIIPETGKTVGDFINQIK